MSDEEKKQLNDESAEQVSGGGLFSSYSEEEYNKAGVTVIGWGYFYNDGYEYQGKDKHGRCQ